MTGRCLNAQTTQSYCYTLCFNCRVNLFLLYCNGLATVTYNHYNRTNDKLVSPCASDSRIATSAYRFWALIRLNDICFMFILLGVVKLFQVFFYEILLSDLRCEKSDGELSPARIYRVRFHNFTAPKKFLQRRGPKKSFCCFCY